MSLWTKIEAALTGGWTSVKTWVAPEVDAAKAALSELEAEIERNGPQLVYDVCVAALTALGTPGIQTGTLIKAAADSAIGTLKAEGKTDITAMVYGTISAALLKMHDTASQAGVVVAPSPSPAPTAA